MWFNKKMILPSEQIEDSLEKLPINDAMYDLSCEILNEHSEWVTGIWYIADKIVVIDYTHKSGRKLRVIIYPDLSISCNMRRLSPIHNVKLDRLYEIIKNHLDINNRKDYY